MKVYIAGPMTGYPDFNYPAFHDAERALIEAGHEPLNPAANFDGDTTRERREYMRRDIEMLLMAEAITFLPGWEKSKGATLEMRIAMELNLIIL